MLPNLDSSVASSPSGLFVTVDGKLSIFVHESAQEEDAVPNLCKDVEVSSSPPPVNKLTYRSRVASLYMTPNEVTSSSLPISQTRSFSKSLRTPQLIPLRSDCWFLESCGQLAVLIHLSRLNRGGPDGETQSFCLWTGFGFALKRGPSLCVKECSVVDNLGCRAQLWQSPFRLVS